VTRLLAGEPGSVPSTGSDEISLFATASRPAHTAFSRMGTGGSYPEGKAAGALI
jgi:hypothetical protein